MKKEKTKKVSSIKDQKEKDTVRKYLKGSFGDWKGKNVSSLQFRFGMDSFAFVQLLDGWENYLHFLKIL